MGKEGDLRVFFTYKSGSGQHRFHLECSPQQLRLKVEGVSHMEGFAGLTPEQKIEAHARWEGLGDVSDPSDSDEEDSGGKRHSSGPVSPLNGPVPSFQSPPQASQAFRGPPTEQTSFQKLQASPRHWIREAGSPLCGLCLLLE